METKKILRIAKGELRDNAVWFMRQAGRYLPEYELLKAGRPFSQFLKDPQAIFDVSSLPLKYFDVDAVVVFTDILLPFTRMGYSVNYENGISVSENRKEDFDYYLQLSKGIRRISETHSGKTVIGVVGGPFTTLSYLFDGGNVGYSKTKEELISGDGRRVSAIIEQIIDFAKLQADAGVDVIQVFDSWLGSVSENYYQRHLRENEAYFIDKIKELGKPVIFYSEGSSHLYRALLDLAPDVYSIDWRMDLDSFRNICGDCIVQGNLDPYMLGTSDEYLKNETRRIMRQGSAFRGHIFNLGHGVKPWTDWRKLSLITNEVHKYEK
ncbi:MAG: uroporphyrinogen decarboxylase family protein [Thermoplasmatales archaeon]